MLIKCVYLHYTQTRMDWESNPRHGKMRHAASLKCEIIELPFFQKLNIIKSPKTGLKQCLRQGWQRMMTVLVLRVSVGGGNHQLKKKYLKKYQISQVNELRSEIQNSTYI